VAAADLPAVQVVVQSSCANELSGGRRRRNAIECESAELRVIAEIENDFWSRWNLTFNQPRPCELRAIPTLKQTA
jgi:hypothetical protein